jgi:nucleoside-diphosphate-sugar epimerase
LPGVKLDFFVSQTPNKKQRRSNAVRSAAFCGFTKRQKNQAARQRAKLRPLALRPANVLLPLRNHMLSVLSAAVFIFLAAAARTRIITAYFDSFYRSGLYGCADARRGGVPVLQ